MSPIEHWGSHTGSLRVTRQLEASASDLNASKGRRSHSSSAVLLAEFGSSYGERDDWRACCVLNAFPDLQRMNQLHGFPDGLSLRTIIEAAAVPRCGDPGTGCLVQGPAIRRTRARI